MFDWGRGWSLEEVAEGTGGAVWRSCCLVESEKVVTEAICDCSVYHVGGMKKAQEVLDVLDICQGAALARKLAAKPPGWCPQRLPGWPRTHARQPLNMELF